MGPLRLMKEAAPRMAEAGWGRILNVTSSSGKRPSLTNAAYWVTKAAQLSLSRVFADTWVSKGVLVNAVAPGPVESPLWMGEGGLAESRWPSARGSRATRRSRPRAPRSLWGAWAARRRSPRWWCSSAPSTPPTSAAPPGPWTAARLQNDRLMATTASLRERVDAVRWCPAPLELPGGIVTPRRVRPAAAALRGLPRGLARGQALPRRWHARRLLGVRDGGGAARPRWWASTCSTTRQASTGPSRGPQISAPPGSARRAGRPRSGLHGHPEALASNASSGASSRSASSRGATSGERFDYAVLGDAAAAPARPGWGADVAQARASTAELLLNEPSRCRSRCCGAAPRVPTW